MQSFPGSQPFSCREQFASPRRAWEKDSFGEVRGGAPPYLYSVHPDDYALVNAAQFAKFDISSRQSGGWVRQNGPSVRNDEPFVGDIASAFEPAKLLGGPHATGFDGCQ